MTAPDTAELAALRAEVRRLQAQLAVRDGQVRTLTALAARLKAENERLTADAPTAPRPAGEE